MLLYSYYTYFHPRDENNAYIRKYETLNAIITFEIDDIEYNECFTMAFPSLEIFNKKIILTEDIHGNEIIINYDYDNLSIDKFYNNKNYVIDIVIDNLIEEGKEINISKNIKIYKETKPTWWFRKNKKRVLYMNKEYNLCNGKKEGIEIEYYPSGLIRKKCNYINGKLNGIYKLFYDNKVLQLKKNYINDKIEGQVISYYDNGEIKEKYNMFNNLYDGKYEEFPSGDNKIYAISNCKNGYNNGIYKIYEDKILIEEGLYDSGDLLYYKKYDNTGKLIEIDGFKIEFNDFIKLK